METISPAKSGDNGTGDEPRTPPAPPGTGARPGPTESGGVWFGVVLAVVALVFASVALVVGRDGSSGGDEGGGGGDTATIELTEFALTPATLSVPSGGQLEVVNAGAVVHNLSIEGTDVATADLAGGDSEVLDLGDLAPGDYTIVCTIAGHADSGMTGTLTVTEGAGGGDAAPAAEDAAGDAAAGGGHAHGGFTEADYQRMSEAMNETIMAFPAETEGAGNAMLEPEVKADGTKVFELTAEIVEWELEPGTFVDAWTYNGMVPGPQMRVDVGDDVEIVVHNELPMATDVHVHGINIPNGMDGVAPITQELIQPGESFTYAFTTDEPAVAMYHPHHHGQMQMPNGMFGAFIVGDVALPTGQTVGGYPIPADLEIDHELPMVLNDSGEIGYSLNGKSFPATEPIVAQQGDWMLVHYYNEGNQIHPMHLHQFDQVVVAKDGFPLDHPYVADTVNVAPGERYTVLVNLDEPGTWVWHCHILNHVESEEGMFGMVTAVVVE
ncbi:MAG TPA: multicopper oxidase domain-containing protein [Acidimicrobiales bacterium]